ncbi:hypothetical protein ACP70R_038952 [Stipagrostis hirtigluma subsp. patula]
MESSLVCRGKRLKLCHNKPICRQRMAQTQFLDLPEDVLSMILSKLPPKEAVRTSVLSSKWKHMWTVCPKLRFDGATMCSEAVSGTREYTQKFVDNVSSVLKQYHGKLVEELEVKFEFDNTLAEHLDDWVNFALSSRAKNLALDLLPPKFGHRPDRYRFPFELFNGDSKVRLQRMQLSFISFNLPSQFSGFPNLKKLDLHVLRVTCKDLQDLLSNCFNLECLSIVRCPLDDELQVVCPLPRLLYLHVAHCGIRKIEFNAMNLQTFVYSGQWLPIHLGHGLKLKDARLYFIEMITLECPLTTLPNLLPRVQNLTLRSYMSLEMPWLLRNSSKFSQLKYLQLRIFVQSEDLNNILSLASFLSAAPFLEKLEIHFTICASPHCSELTKTLPRCTHSYLKDLYITGFAGCTGQVEFLVYIVENAPNLELLTLDRADYFGDDEDYERRTRFNALDIAKRHLDGRISENTKFFIA